MSESVQGRIYRILYEIDDQAEQWREMEALLREAYEEGESRDMSFAPTSFEEWWYSG